LQQRRLQPLQALAHALVAGLRRRQQRRGARGAAAGGAEVAGIQDEARQVQRRRHRRRITCVAAGCRRRRRRRWLPLSLRGLRGAAAAARAGGDKESGERRSPASGGQWRRTRRPAGRLQQRAQSGRDGPGLLAPQRQDALGAAAAERDVDQQAAHRRQHVGQRAGVVGVAAAAAAGGLRRDGGLEDGHHLFVRLQNV
jgi:hypothetical protein